MGSPLKELERVVTGEKVWPETETPATATFSVKMGPETVEPSPY